MTRTVEGPTITVREMNATFDILKAERDAYLRSEKRLADERDAWREHALAQQALCAGLRIGRTPVKAIDRAHAARARLDELGLI